MLKSREHSPWYDLYIAAPGVFVALVALAAGVSVPLRIDNDAQAGRARGADSGLGHRRRRLRADTRHLPQFGAPRPKGGLLTEALGEQVHTGREQALTRSPDPAPTDDTLDWTIDCIKQPTAYASD
ncbi:MULTISPECIES: hypothetical protein [unclassified Amycolatopsis]|uniref:hypothetical protein n=1 Tax=unclassified Amycolatopsis TaxID=2618356 RepID=UPI000F76B7D5|nr:MULTISPECIES: hypothetical protein [unclassified Amycolatopsis]